MPFIFNASVAIEKYNNMKKLYGLFYRHGGWILDNFPNTRDQWNLCIEKNFLPDDVIVLKDSGDGSKFLMKRWYNMHKDEIDEKIRQRIKEEEERKIRLEAERK
jgi:adenylate/nucleoside-diphosphate kinase